MASDRELVSKVAGGDSEAFHRLYDRFADRVLRSATTILRNRHLAEEATQETMIALWKGASRFAGRSKVSTWLFGIARHRAYDLVRKEERGRRLPDTPLSSPDPSNAILLHEKVMEALNGLSSNQREVVFLTFYEGLSYKEIAEILEIPQGTVKSRMFHAKRKLAGVLT